MSQDLLFFLIPIGIVVLGVMIYYRVAHYRRRWFMTHSKSVTVTVIDITEDERVYSHRVYTTYKVQARWQDPATGIFYVYESKGVSSLPRKLYPGESKVNVYVMPDDPEKYLFEL